MRKIEISEEIMKQWHEDYEESLHVPLKYYPNTKEEHESDHIRWCWYYEGRKKGLERIKELEKDILDQRSHYSNELKLSRDRFAPWSEAFKKRDERILDLEKKVDKYVGMHSEAFNNFEQEKYEHENSNRYHKEKIAKRDELLDQAMMCLKFHAGDKNWTREDIELFNQVLKLKEGSDE